MLLKLVPKAWLGIDLVLIKALSHVLSPRKGRYLRFYLVFLLLPWIRVSTKIKIFRNLVLLRFEFIPVQRIIQEGNPKSKLDTIIHGLWWEDLLPKRDRDEDEIFGVLFMGCRLFWSLCPDPVFLLLPSMGFWKKSWVLKFLICYDLGFFQFSGPVRVSNEKPFNQSVLHLTIAFLLVVTILVGKGRRTDCKGGQREKSAEVARGRIEIKERRREGYVDLF